MLNHRQLYIIAPHNQSVDRTNYVKSSRLIRTYEHGHLATNRAYFERCMFIVCLETPVIHTLGGLDSRLLLYRQLHCVSKVTNML